MRQKQPKNTEMEEDPGERINKQDCRERES